MIKFENIEVVGWEAAIRGMRNPMNSWDKEDSAMGQMDIAGGWGYIGPNDLSLMKKLCNAGTDHRKFMRMIVVYVDITAPLYWWKEFDTYKVGTVANSCSTMHKIAEKEFTLEDFSHEHLISATETNTISEVVNKLVNVDGHLCYFTPSSYMRVACNMLNYYRELYLETKDKKYWWQMIQLLPSSYNQRRTVEMNYEVLANIYKSRKDHKLDEWRIGFMDWIKTLPYSELITGEENE
jgi:hypothetical protein